MKTCNNCRNFHPGYKQCRRYPPQVTDKDECAEWPTVDDPRVVLCGEWKRPGVQGPNVQEAEQIQED